MDDAASPPSHRKVPGADPRDRLGPPGLSLPRFPPPPVAPPRRQRWSFLLMVVLPSLIGAVYYLHLAPPQYVTNAVVALRVGEEQQTGAGGGPSSLTGALGPTNAGAPVTQSYGIVHYFASASAMQDVAAAGLDVRAIFTNPNADILTRLPPDASPEALLRAWRRAIAAQFELTRGVVTLSVRAFTAEESLALAEALLRAGEQLSNDMSRRMYADKLRFATEQVEQSEQRFTTALAAVQAFRAESGVMDPDRASQAGMAIEMQLRQELAVAEAQAEALRASVGPASPMFAAASARARALRASLADGDRQSSRASGDRSGPAWAAVLARNEALVSALRIAEQHYTQSLTLMQNARAEAAQQRSYLLTFVRPVLATEADYPNRWLSVLIVGGCALLAWGMVLLLYHAIMDQM